MGRTAEPPARVQVGISIGIGGAGPTTADPDADRLFTLADTAVYRAKALGGTTSVIARLD